MTKVSGQLLVLHTQILSTSMFACNASYTWTTVTVRRTQSALPIHSFDRDNLHTEPIFINTRRYHIALYSCIGLYKDSFPWEVEISILLELLESPKEFYQNLITFVFNSPCHEIPYCIETYLQ